MKPTLFLDVDGVCWGFHKSPVGEALPLLDHARKHEDPDNFMAIAHGLRDPELAKANYRPFRHEFDPVCVGLLTDVVIETGAQVVLSSSWRVIFHYSMVDRFMHYVDPRWPLGTIIDKTPSNRTTGPRAAEINKWMSMNSIPMETKFCVVDDSSDAWGDGFEFVLTNGYFGFTEEDKVKAINALTET